VLARLRGCARQNPTVRLPATNYRFPDMCYLGEETLEHFGTGTRGIGPDGSVMIYANETRFLD